MVASLAGSLRALVAGWWGKVISGVSGIQSIVCKASALGASLWAKVVGMAAGLVAGLLSSACGCAFLGHGSVVWLVLAFRVVCAVGSGVAGLGLGLSRCL